MLVLRLFRKSVIVRYIVALSCVALAFSIAATFVSGGIGWARLVGYFLLCGTIIYLVEAMRRARQRTEQQKEQLANDITEREQIEEAHRRSDQRSALDLQAMTRLQEVGAICARTGNTLNESLETILQAAITLTGADKGNIQLIDESGALTIAAHSGFDESFLSHFARVGPEHAAVCAAAKRSAQRVIVEDVTQSNIFAGQPSLNILLEAGVHAVQSTPLISTSGTVLGMVSTHFIEPHKLSEKELRLMDLLARQAADYLEHKRAEDALNQTQIRLSDELERMSRLHAISVQMAHTDDFQSLLQQILAAAADFTRTDKGNIQFLDSETGELRIIVHQGLGQRFIEHFSEHGWWATCDEALRKGERVIVEDVANEPTLQETPELEIILEDHILAIQSTPLVCRDGRLLGMLNTHFRQVHRPSEIDLRYLDLLARMAADLIDRVQVQERLRETEKEVRRARDVAEEASRLKDEFLAIMSHELRNPLNVILGYSELLLRSEESSRSPELLRTSEAIKRNALIQARLIRDLLDLSRLRSGKISLNKETVLLLVAVNHAVETVRSDADAKNIEIQVVATGDPLFVKGDPVRLAQIVWNLLNNSVKFTPPGGRISVQLDSKDNQACVTVRDTGKGIESSFLPHVFEMFRQADARTNRTHSGMGIGLAVVHQLVQLHKGSINAFSAGPGKGATFSLQLPLSSEAKALPASALSLALALNNLSILVVDDSEDTTEMLTTLLSIKGAKVIPATSGNEALRVVADRDFDVVLSDISMPGMDGFEFLKRLRQIPGKTDVPVLALTGFGRPEDIERAKAEGFFSHVTKPFELEALIGVLQKLPKKRR